MILNFGNGNGHHTAMSGLRRFGDLLIDPREVTVVHLETAESGVVVCGGGLAFTVSHATAESLIDHLDNGRVEKPFAEDESARIASQTLPQTSAGMETSGPDTILKINGH